MDIHQAEAALAENPYSLPEALRDCRDAAASLRQTLQNRAAIDAKLAEFERALPGLSPARQLVLAHELRSEFGRELLRREQERQTAQATIAKRHADASAAHAARSARDLFRARTTSGAQAALQTFQARIGGLLLELGQVENTADLAAIINRFDEVTAGARGSLAAALAPHITPNDRAA